MDDQFQEIVSYPGRKGSLSGWSPEGIVIFHVLMTISMKQCREVYSKNDNEIGM
jgi:hypothetical protein